jgi:CRISPR/Cas system-associated protein Csx1
MRIKRLLTDSGYKGIDIFMRNERLELALAWCKKNNIESIRLKKFNRESKKKEKQSKKERRKFLTEKARYKV